MIATHVDDRCIDKAIALIDAKINEFTKVRFVLMQLKLEAQAKGSLFDREVKLTTYKEGIGWILRSANSPLTPAQITMFLGELFDKEIKGNVVRTVLTAGKKEGLYERRKQGWTAAEKLLAGNRYPESGEEVMRRLEEYTRRLEESMRQLKEKIDEPNDES